MKIKICGITNYADAMDAIDAGADAIGFVFYEKSIRYIKPDDAKKIIKSLPPFIKNVGLFVNKSANEINQISQIANIDIAQIHFEATDTLFNNLQIPYLKVVRVKQKQDLLKYPNEYKIVDAFVQNYGGEGKRIPIEWFKGIDTSKMIIAGGLTPNNLEQLKEFDIYGLDVSSGVEQYKGKKDKLKMEQFILNAKKIFT